MFNHVIPPLPSFMKANASITQDINRVVCVTLSTDYSFVFTKECVHTQGT